MSLDEYVMMTSAKMVEMDEKEVFLTFTNS